MTQQPAAIYADALVRFCSSTGINAAELAELAGLEPVVVFDAIEAIQLPTAAARGMLAVAINSVKRERGL